jgi:hypothetical protein
VNNIAQITVQLREWPLALTQVKTTWGFGV